MQAFCHDSWKGVEDLSELISVQTIEGSRVCIVDDQPARLDAAIKAFLASLDRSNADEPG